MAISFDDDQHLIYFLRFCQEKIKINEVQTETALVSRLEPFVRFLKRRYSEMIKHFYENTNLLDISKIWRTDPICGPFIPMFLTPCKKRSDMRTLVQNIVEYICAGKKGLALEQVFIDYNTPNGPNRSLKLMKIWLVKKKPLPADESSGGGGDETQEKIENRPYFVLTDTTMTLSSRSNSFEIIFSSFVSQKPSNLIDASNEPKTVVPRIGAVLFDPNKSKNFRRGKDCPFTIFFFKREQKNRDLKFSEFENVLDKRNTTCYYLNSEIDFFCGLKRKHRDLVIVYANERIFELAEQILNYRGQ